MNPALVERRFSVVDSARLHWHRLGEDDPEDVVVFDNRTGQTHRIAAEALEVHALLVSHPQGLSSPLLHQALWGPQAACTRDVPSSLDCLLQAMHQAGLIECTDAHDDQR